MIRLPVWFRFPALFLMCVVHHGLRRGQLSRWLPIQPRQQPHIRDPIVEPVPIFPTEFLVITGVALQYERGQKWNQPPNPTAALAPHFCCLCLFDEPHLMLSFLQPPSKIGGSVLLNCTISLGKTKRDRGVRNASLFYLFFYFFET